MSHCDVQDEPLKSILLQKRVNTGDTMKGLKPMGHEKWLEYKGRLGSQSDCP